MPTFERLHDVEWRRRQREVLFDAGTIGSLERLGVAEGWRCLEIGAGRGSIAMWLVDRVGPHRVTATDIRDEYLAPLRQRLTGIAAVWRHDVSAQPLPSSEFDLVHARFVLEHLPQRDAVVVKLVNAVRPGGWLLLEDAEFSPCLATGGAYGAAMSAFVSAMGLIGTDYSWTLRLPEAMTSADLAVIEAAGSTRFFGGASAEAEFWAANWLDVRARLERVGLSDAALEAAFAELSDSRRWFAGPVVVTAAGKRPS